MDRFRITQIAPVTFIFRIHGTRRARVSFVGKQQTPAFIPQYFQKRWQLPDAFAPLYVARARRGNFGN